MGKIQYFEDLEAWRSAHYLARGVYRATKAGAFSRDFALRDQIRRAAISIVSNIAEGFESRTTPLFVEFIGRAKASAGEVRAQLYLARDEGYIDQITCRELIQLAMSVSRQISGFTKYLERHTRRKRSIHSPQRYPKTKN